VRSTVTINGQAGELRHGYQTLATLRGWTLTREICRLTPATVYPDAFADAIAAKAPLVLRLEMGAYIWTYPAVTVVSQGPPIVVRFTGSPDVKTLA
jgi:hypothetical protein